MFFYFVHSTFSTVLYLLAHSLVCDLSLCLLYGYCAAGLIIAVLLRGGGDVAST